MVRLAAILCLCFGGIVPLSANLPAQVPQAAEGSPLHIVPQPLSVVRSAGFFTVGPGTVLVYHTGNPETQKSVLYLADILRRSTGFPLKVVDAAATPRKDYISFRPIRDESLHREGYRLEVRDDAVVLEANNDPGFFYAAQTVLQLLPPEVYAVRRPKLHAWKLPCVTIIDTPRYTWRGFMLDVSRHFLPKQFVKKVIDYLAMHKMNTFHWHLNDDQGWRIEIKKYPRLTQTSAWRADKEDVHWNIRPAQTAGEPALYGGFYTQDEIREIVRYAADRYITIVPEIEMPSHATAVLTAFPELSCTGGPFTVPPGSVWPIKDIYCGGNDSVFVFLENVLAEVVDLFPGTFLHIGGDEADKTEWRRCPKCQARIRAEGLADEMELQSYFTRRIETTLTRLGKRLIGWDEIIEGGLPPRTAVMSWRGTQGGIEAARSGHDVVMTPTSHCYLDYYQGAPVLEPLAIGGYLPLETVYSFEPTPDSLTPAEARHILGVQANLWAEYVPDSTTAEYMIFPRIAATAELGWTARSLRSWPSFLDRLETQFKRYDARGINAARSIMAVSVTDSFDTAAWKRIVALSSQSGRGEIRYTLDGSTPTSLSALYREPFDVSTSCTLTTATFKEGRMIGPTTVRRLSVTPFRAVSVLLSSPPENAAADAGGGRLIDHRRASPSASDIQWTGWKGRDITIILDLGSVVPVHRLTAGFFHETVRLAFPPPAVAVSISEDGVAYTHAGYIQHPSPVKDPRPVVRDYTLGLQGMSARFVKLVATSPGPAPDWHKFALQPTWIYADEITVE